MNRTLLPVAAAYSASSLLLIDSALKGAMILLVAAFAAALLKRDSAATRHLVWLVAIVAVLVVPLFATLLPQWRALPAWAAISREPPVRAPAPDRGPSAPFVATGERQTAAVPSDAPPADLGGPLAASGQPIASALVSQTPLVAPHTAPTVAAPRLAPAPTRAPWHWSKALSLTWAIGCGALILRLATARLLLWRRELRCVRLGRSGGRSELESSDDPLVAAFLAAQRQLKIRRRVRLLIHSEQTIPVVWGTLRHRLLLPAAARQWSEEQLRSVLLHELAHIQRRDTAAQLLAQLACAVHWFNPLVWLAARRLHVERERACDDLVLRQGVRASAYAEHLLQVTTQLSTSTWAQACGLAMASPSSLESRLAAVLSASRNRRGVTSSIAVAGLLLGAAIAVPVAMLRAAETVIQQAETSDPPEMPPQKEPLKAPQKEPLKEPLKDPQDDRPVPPPVAAELKPRHADGQALFRIWQSNARADGKIPGARIGQLGEWAKYFIELNEGHEHSVKMKALLPRFVASRDWTQADAVGLLDDICAIQTIPLRNALDAAAESEILTGDPLPPELADAPWGQPAANGLRAAWLVTPSAKEYRLGTSLRSTILVHNSGPESVFFIMPSWQQTGQHAAHDGEGAAIDVTSTSWTTMAQMAIYRLPPGAYCETRAPGVGVGARSEDEDWANVRVGSWILASEGDEVRFTPGPVEVRYSPFVVGVRHGNELQKPTDAADLWQKFVAERVARETPIPTGAADRELLLRRVVRDLYGATPDAAEIAAFVADKSPGGLHPILGEAMVRDRVQHKRSISPFTGTLPPGDIRFRVLAADPDAAKRPRSAFGPGYFTLGDQQRLQVERTRRGDRLANKATIRFFSSAPKTEPPAPPFEIALPDGWRSYALAWDRGAGTLWIAHAGVVRSCDFSNPAKVTESRFEPGKIAQIPEQFRPALRPFLLAPNPAPKPQGGAMLQPGVEERIQWGPPANGLRAALIRPPALGQPEAGQAMDFNLVVQNVSDAPIRVVANATSPNPRKLTVSSKQHGWALFQTASEEPTLTNWLLQPRQVGVLRMFPPNRAVGNSISRNLDLIFSAEMEILQAPSGAWIGKLATAPLEAAFAAHGLLPQHQDARELFKIWNAGIRWNRQVPGAHIGLLADNVALFTQSPAGKATPGLLEMLPRLDATRDWDGHEALQLLDELAKVQTAPIKMTLEDEARRLIRTGAPLPQKLANDAPWGAAQPNGLRVAWLLTPQGAEHRLGATLQSRILFHNSGPNDVVFRTRLWHQSSQHRARDAKGAAIEVSATRSTREAPTVPFRLKPGEYAEVPSAGIGVGPPGKPIPPSDDGFVGAWIDAPAGAEVTFIPAPVSLNDVQELKSDRGADGWWLDLIAARVRRELPLPQDDEVRRRLVYHVAMDLFGTPVGDEYTSAFLADRGPNALDALAQRLAERPGVTPVVGALQSGPTKFRVRP